jgi:hypothetical protein
VKNWADLRAGVVWPRLPFVLVVVGIALLVAGVTFSTLPVDSEPSHAVSNTQPFAENLSGASITGSVAGTLAWTASAPVEFYFLTCSSRVTNGLCEGSGTRAFENGTSGTFTFQVHVGGVVGGGFFNRTGVTGSVSVTLAPVTAGLVLLIGGAALWVVGVTPWKRILPPPSASPEAARPPSEADVPLKEEPPDGEIDEVR